MAMAISSIIPGLRGSQLVEAALEERLAAVEEDHGAEHRRDPGGAGKHGRLVAEEFREHGAEEDHRHGQGQGQPEPVPEHRHTVPGVLAVAVHQCSSSGGACSADRQRGAVPGSCRAASSCARAVADAGDPMARGPTSGLLCRCSMVSRSWRGMGCQVSTLQAIAPSIPPGGYGSGKRHLQPSRTASCGTAPPAEARSRRVRRVSAGGIPAHHSGHAAAVVEAARRTDSPATAVTRMSARFPAPAAPRPPRWRPRRGHPGAGHGGG